MSIWWNGISSDDVGVVVEHYPAIYLPERKTNFYTVCGRSGDVVRQKSEWNNYTQVYDIYFKDDAKHLQDAAHRVAEWLYSGQGYCRLEDSYDLGVYREAVFVGGQEIENTLNRFGRVTIEFNCKPYKYLVTGDRWIDITNATYYNPVIINGGSDILQWHPIISLDADGPVNIRCALNRYNPIDEVYTDLSILNATGIYEIDTENGEITSHYNQVFAPYSQAGLDLRFNMYDGKLYLIESFDEHETRSVKIKPRFYRL